jgi:uncharacterized protein (DUF433 family)
MTLEVKTEHPHIVRAEGIRGGRPVIKNTSIEVALIVKLYKKGDSADEILSAYPHLSPAAVYDALSYYHDHQEEIEKFISNQNLRSVLKHNALTITSHGQIVPKEK